MIKNLEFIVCLCILYTSTAISNNERTFPLKMKAPIVANVDMSSVKTYIDDKINTEVHGIVQKEVKKQINKQTKTLTDHLDSQIQGSVGREVEKAVKADVEKLSRKLNRNIDFIIERQVQKVVSSEMKVLLDKLEKHKVPKFKPRDCLDVRRRKSQSGVYTVYPDDSTEFPVYCDMATDGGGWTEMKNYTIILTVQGKYEMRIELEDYQGNTAYASYSTFSVGDRSSFYKIRISGYSGTAGDSLAYHNGQAFTTKDKDNDQNEGNCAEMREGAWWYKSCYHSNLNGRFGKTGDTTGMRWFVWKGNHSVKATKMMIRRKN